MRDDKGDLHGVEAVIDKDRASSVLAGQIGADVLFLLTQVEKVSLDFGKPGQRDIDVMTVADAGRYLEDGEFPPGSMGPKVESAIAFLEAGGHEVVITRPELLSDALSGNRCTRIVR